jgi:ribose-phosphate pyrophosphokinase
MRNSYVGKTDDVVLLTGTSNPQLARTIAKILKKEKQFTEPISFFSDGEIRVKIPHNLRQRHVIIVQSTSSPVNDHIMELIFLIDAAKRSSAREITAIIPYFGYSRQDRKEMPRVPISAAVIANIIERAGVDRIVTMDIHSEQQQGFIHAPWDNLYGSYALLPLIKKMKLSNVVVASPDKGGVTRATAFARLVNAEGIAIVFKDRDLELSNRSEAMNMIGEVKGKDVLLVDDMIDTGGTLTNAANLIKERGAKSVRAAAVHGIFSGKAIENITNSALEEVLVTDTIALSEELKNHPKIRVVSVAPLLAEAIGRIQTGESLSRDLILKV